MQGMGPASRTKFLKRQLFRSFFSVFRRRIIFSLTLVASKADEFPHERSRLSVRKLLEDLGHDPCADGLTAFANRKFQAFVHGDRRYELDLYIDIVARHNHLRALR